MKRRSASNLLAALRTPLFTLIRGRIAPQRTPRKLVADLPDPVARTVLQIVRRAKLSRHERAQLARELTDRITARLTAGATVDEILAEIGPVKAAAKAARRAARARRHWTLRLIRGAGLAFFILVLTSLAGYALLAVYLMQGKPVVDTDDLGQITSAAAHADPAECAWPLYLHALGVILNGTAPKLSEKDAVDAYEDWPGADDPKWAVVDRWLADHAGDLAMVRQACEKPHWGYVASLRVQGVPLSSFAVSDRQWSRVANLLSMNAMAVPRRLTRLLTLDSMRGLHAGDADRIVADLHAIMRLAGQLRELPTVYVWFARGSAIESVLREWDAILDRRPELMSDPQLRQMMRELRETDAVLTIDIGGDRLLFHDKLQRLYTPGPRGHLVWRGAEIAGLLLGGPTAKPDSEPLVLRPAVIEWVGNRGWAMAEYDRLFAEMQRRAAEPTWDWKKPLEDTEKHGMFSMTHDLVFIDCGAFADLPEVAEKTRARRDAVVTAAALELFRRKHGAYPAKLTELVPEYLPAVPRDRFDGQPIRYRLAGGRPLLWSVGVDRVDDGGHAPRLTIPLEDTSTWEPTEVVRKQLENPKTLEAITRRGDWILFPRSAMRRK